MAQWISPWQETELVFVASKSHLDPYRDVEVWVEFKHDASHQRMIRPAFWDGDSTWRVRFCSTEATGVWHWTSYSNIYDSGLSQQSGRLEVQTRPTDHLFYANGFAGKRNLMHANGRPALLCGDTAWALPWRGTESSVTQYAQDRQRKGFNASLLMVLQPDMDVNGPESRTEDYGFARSFDDLPQGHLNRIRPEYFQYLDRLIQILIAHEIVPVYQPTFHGYGWKGQRSIGTVVATDEAARFCRYLVARYGARPAIYLIGADGFGELDSIRASGEAVERWDAYQQPTGMHYNPMGSNCACQSADWLDFQWCQTGHGEEHMPERVMHMWHQLPEKAISNAEPTYERMGGHKAAGWWQGHEAWSNLCAGGTMGVVYGAASLWQWRLHRNEPGHQDWCMDPASGWQEALGFEGSNYPGVIRRILEQYQFLDMRPDWQMSFGKRGLIAEGTFYLCYVEQGDDLWLVAPQRLPTEYTVFCAQTGAALRTGQTTDQRPIPLTSGRPMIVVCGKRIDSL